MKNKELTKSRHPGITSKEYHAIKMVEGPGGLIHQIASKSTLSSFIENPQTWKEGIQFKGSRSMDMGSLIDAICLEPSLFETEFKKRPEQWKDFRSKDAKAWRDQQKVLGFTVVDDNMLQEAQIATNNLQADKSCQYILEHSEKQVGYFQPYCDQIWAKSLMDIVPDAASDYGSAIVDMKRTVAFDPSQFKYELKKRRYHWQAAMYLDMHNMVTGENRDRFIFMVSNSQRPFNAGLAEIDSEFIEAGRQEYMAAMELYLQCWKNNSFPSPYSNGPVLIKYK